MKTERIYYLDWLRVAAFWILIFFHSWQPFTSFETFVKSDVPSLIADIMTVFLHTWRLHLIFLISGVGTWFAMRKSKTNFLKNRFQRLVIPFIVGVVLITPAQHYFEALQDNTTTLSFFEFMFSYIDHHLTDHNYGFSILQWNIGVAAHLWYLSFLYIMTLVLLPVLRYIKTPEISTSLSLFIEKNPNRLFLLVLPIILCRLILKPIFPAYTDVADFFTYSWSFIYGYFLIQNHAILIKAIQKNQKKLLIVGIVSSLGLIVGSANENLLQAALNPSYNIYHLIVTTLIGLSAVAWPFFWVSFFSKKVNNNHSILKEANESILPTYVIHQTVIVCFGYYILKLEIPLIFQFLLIALATVVFSILFYKLVATNNLTRFLTGMNKKSKFKK